MLDFLLNWLLLSLNRLGSFSCFHFLCLPGHNIILNSPNHIGIVLNRSKLVSHTANLTRHVLSLRCQLFGLLDHCLLLLDGVSGVLDVILRSRYFPTETSDFSLHFLLSLELLLVVNFLLFFRHFLAAFVFNFGLHFSLLLLQFSDFEQVFMQLLQFLVFVLFFLNPFFVPAFHYSTESLWIVKIDVIDNPFFPEDLQRVCSIFSLPF